MQDSLNSNSVGLVKPNKVHFNKKLVLASGNSLNGEVKRMSSYEDIAIKLNKQKSIKL